MTQNRRTIPATDGYELAATVFAPEDGEPDGWMVIHSAIAMPRRFYRSFASWFAERGIAAVTYDFRGIGDSAPEDLRGFDASISDWIGKDMEAVVGWAEQRAANRPLYLVGHSLGGQVIGCLGNRFDIDAAATVSAQSGYWRRQYPGEEWKLAASMTLIIPTVATLLGYLPWSRVFGGEDLPKRAALQWASWCRDPEYLLGDERVPNRDGFQQFSAPILAYSFDDDTWGYRKAVDWMMSQFKNASVDRRHLAPSDLGLEEIGHFRFFFPELDELWEELFEWLHKQSDSQTANRDN